MQIPVVLESVIGNAQQNVLIRQALEQQAESKLAQFSSALLPGMNRPVLGVRIPQLRQMAQILAKGDWRTYLRTAVDDSFEELLLQGLTAGYATVKAGQKGQPSLQETFQYYTAYVDRIDSWSLCDSFVPTLKLAKKQSAEVWNFVVPFLSSPHVYAVRFGVVMLLAHFLDKEHIQQVLTLLQGITRTDYYISMAVAWALSFCYIKFPQPTWEVFLHPGTLPIETLERALQKSVESLRISPRQRQLLRDRKKQLKA